MRMGGSVGELVGDLVGLWVGRLVGDIDGVVDGSLEGKKEGRSDGTCDGIVLGSSDGIMLSVTVGDREGEDEEGPRNIPASTAMPGRLLIEYGAGVISGVDIPTSRGSIKPPDNVGGRGGEVGEVIGIKPLSTDAPELTP